MSTLNKITLIGRVGKMNDVRYTQAGKPVVSFSMATGNSYTNKATGEKVDNTQWHNVTVISEGLARVAQQFLAKGSRVYVEGELRTRTYTAKDGAEKLAVEVVLGGYNSQLVLLDDKKKEAVQDAAGEYDVAASAATIHNDDIPF